MAVNNGDVFSAGIRILLRAANDALAVNAGPIAYLHLVDPDGATIVPTYESQGLQTPAGFLSGARYVLSFASLAALTALTTRTSALEAGGRWSVPVPYVGAAAAGSVSLALTIGTYQRTNLIDFGTGDMLTCTLPLATSAMVGRQIAIVEISNQSFDGLGARLRFNTTSSQTIDVNRTLPLELFGERPKIVFVAVEHSASVYGWSVLSRTADP